MAFTVAIDGPAASGKGTISRAVAEHFGFAHLDTGLLYRAVGRKVLEGVDPIKAAKALVAEDLQRDDLRTTEVAQAASKTSPIPEVRAALRDFQHAFVMRSGGAVLDGRDIGTVICPDAQVKLFVTASDKVRAERRYLELAAKGQDVTREGVLEDLRVRDKRDRERESSPMVAAKDALVLDTSAMSIDEAVAKAVAVIERRMR